MATTRVLSDKDTVDWRKVILQFDDVDICQTPEYHRIYSTRILKSMSRLWVYDNGNDCFAYPFMMTPVFFNSFDNEIIETPYFDISSTYGYSGPLTTSRDKAFVNEAWIHFDQWAKKEKIIADFTRFSVYTNAVNIAHPDMEVVHNRLVAISPLNGGEDQFFAGLPSKTRNMIRKAHKNNLEAVELDLDRHLNDFRDLYDSTMQRNDAPEFFAYDDNYYDLLTKLPEGELRLFGVFHDERLISTAMAIIHQTNALYHLGASLNEYSYTGAGNLVLYKMSVELIKSGVRFLNVGGGRTQSEDDPLLRFKKNNALDVADYYIGKRIIDSQAYAEVKSLWTEHYPEDISVSKLIFWRSS